jgi:hypothetical protein
LLLKSAVTEVTVKNQTRAAGSDGAKWNKSKVRQVSRKRLSKPKQSRKMIEVRQRERKQDDLRRNPARAQKQDLENPASQCAAREFP